MNILSWLPFGRKADSETPASPQGRGPVTGCDLSDVEMLARPFAQDPFCRLRPPFSREAAQRSLELAEMAYTLDAEPWQEAGWNDFSILIDDSLQTGITGADNPQSRAKLAKARAALRESNPVSQLKSMIRQKERSDTVKAVCMAHSLPGDKWLIAIGFMGTGSRFYDWISNFRFTPEEGFHRGFYQLCESFESYAEEIVFPSVAAALGLEKLTLGDIFTSMKSLSCPFRLWMAGHSQGSAVMQVLTFRLMTDWGVQAQNMTGYGFASPTVATGRFIYDPAAYPVCHLLNRDDPVTRMGALLHLGICLEYPADQAFRDQVYGLSRDAEDEALRERLAFLEEGMTDMPAVILRMTALMQCLAEEKGAEGLGELVNSWWSIPAVDKVLWRTSDKVMEGIGRLLESAREAHIALTGYALSERQLERLMEEIRPIVKETSVRRLIRALISYGSPPHRLADREEGRGAYAAIVRDGLNQLEPFIWIKAAQGLPTRRYTKWTLAWPAGAFGRGERVRRMAVRQKEMRGKLRLSFSAQKKS